MPPLRFLRCFWQPVHTDYISAKKVMRFFLLSAALVPILVACSKSPQPGQVKTPAAEPVVAAATPLYPDIESLSGMLDSGATASAQLVADALQRARENSGLNAFISLDVEGAASQAEELDRQRATGQRAGPLSGIPLVVKDNIHVAGMPNTAGTPVLKDFVPTASNEVVARLQAAGAIIIGKTNMHELAFGVTSNNAAFGAVRNPYANSLLPGGSSGGTAAAISAGIVAAGLGTDTGGSVRIPAALTGITGFRPSNGRYPSQAVTPVSHTRDTIGVMGRKVMDLVLLDETIVADAMPLTEVPASAIRLGVPRGYFYQDLDAELAVVVDLALQKLSAAKVQLVEADIPDIGSLVAASSFQIAGFEIVRDLPAYLENYSTGVVFADLVANIASPDVQRLMAWVTGEEAVTEESYQAGLRARQQLRQNFDAYFASQKLDAIIFPTTQLPARPIAGSDEAVDLNGAQVPTFPTYVRNTTPASMAALPGISLPAGLTAAGLPVGMEIDGPEQSDRHLLAVARTLEAIFDFRSRK
jgi:mandelamide amidase